MPEPITSQNSLLLVIDIQEKLFPLLFNKDEFRKNTEKFLKCAKILEIDALLTEQYPNGLGKTCGFILENMPKHESVEKTSFDCCGNKQFNDKLKKFRKKNIIIIGIETHICVTQTAESLIEQGYNVHIAADCISARKPVDHHIGIERMKQIGANLATWEMIVYKFLKSKENKCFKDVLEVLKG